MTSLPRVPTAPASTTITVLEVFQVNYPVDVSAFIESWALFHPGEPKDKGLLGASLRRANKFSESPTFISEETWSDSGAMLLSRRRWGTFFTTVGEQYAERLFEFMADDPIVRITPDPDHHVVLLGAHSALYRERRPA